MAKKMSINQDDLSNIHTFPESGLVLAVVVGIEEYQDRTTDALPNVDYARSDVEGFTDTLRIIYGDERLDLQLVVDNNATLTTIRYTLRQAIGSLTEEDLFIFYYAGHGFYGAGGNRITAWDTNTFNIEDTTLLLSDVLIDPLTASICPRALAFVDACATEFEPLIRARDIVHSMNHKELKSFLSSAQYCALFLSCAQGQKSYPSDFLKQGIWTHFLLKALRGEDETALGPGRYLTDSGLRDYLRHQVPRYMREKMSRLGNKPHAR